MLLRLVHRPADERSRRPQRGLDESAQAWQNQRRAGVEAEDQTDKNADALAELQGKTQDTSGDIEDLADQIRGFGSATLDMREANRNLEAAYDDLTDSIAQNGTSLDTTTEAGRANEAALDAIAQRAVEAAASTLEQTGSQEEANAVLQAGRDRLIDMLSAFGITGQAAEDYVDNLDLIPENIITAINLSGVDDAEGQITYLTRDRTVTAQVRTDGSSTVNYGQGNNKAVIEGKADRGIMDFYANGGLAESHIAEIAPAGAWRIWAEPETGGEAYIPLALGKRDRSVDIWEETGRRLGVLSYADGAIAARQGYATPNYAAAAPGVAGQQPLVGPITLQSTGNMRSDLDEVDHELRRFRRGGR